MFKFIALILTTATLRNSFSAVASVPPSKIKLIIIEGVSHHDWKYRLELVKEILAKDGSFDVDVSLTPSVADDPVWQSWRPSAPRSLLPAF